jgi:hypothetical protein
MIEPDVLDSPDFRDNVRPCPKCCGGRPWVNPFEQVLDRACPMCDGTKRVFEGLFCHCGRPAIYVYKMELLCKMADCKTEADKRISEKKTTSKDHWTMGDSTKDIDNAANHWAHLY